MTVDGRRSDKTQGSHSRAENVTASPFIHSLCLPMPYSFAFLRTSQACAHIQCFLHTLGAVVSCPYFCELVFCSKPFDSHRQAVGLKSKCRVYHTKI